MGSTKLVRLVPFLLGNLVSGIGIFAGGASQRMASSVFVALEGTVGGLSPVQLSSSDVWVEVLVVKRCNTRSVWCGESVKLGP